MDFGPLWQAIIAEKGAAVVLAGGALTVMGAVWRGTAWAWQRLFSSAEETTAMRANRDTEIAEVNAIASQAIARINAETLQSVVQSAMQGVTTPGGQPFVAMVDRRLSAIEADQRGAHEHLKVLNGRLGRMEREASRQGWPIVPVYGTDAELGETGASDG